ncbi:MAG: hypothetical protein WAU32_02835 [Thermoanaerobaculia bacterium]
MGYDAGAKVYTWDGYNSVGQKSHVTGTVEGKTWTFNTESEMNGKTIKVRTVLVEESPTGYRFTVEMSEDGKTWSAPVMVVKITKTGAAERN